MQETAILYDYSLTISDTSQEQPKEETQGEVWESPNAEHPFPPPPTESTYWPPSVFANQEAPLSFTAQSIYWGFIISHD